MLQPGIILKRSRKKRLCPACCEICHCPTKRKVAIDNKPRTICKTCDALRKKRRRGKTVPFRWHAIFYWIEGGVKRYRCTHGAGLFAVAAAEKETSTIVCTFGYCHQVLTGFVVSNEERE